MFGKWFGRRRESAEALKASGNAALQRGDVADAEAFYRDAIGADARFMPAHYNLGNVLRLQGRHAEAVDAYGAAAALAPDDYEVHVNMGVALIDLARFDEALAVLHRAAALAPKAIEPAVNLGIALDRSGRTDEAIDAWDRALGCDPDCAVARYNRSLAYLRQGRWDEGFREHESRLELPHAVPTDLLAGKPEWDGASLAGKTLLVYPEQGLGDMLQFLRYARLCKEAGARVMVCCQPPLASLLETSADVDVVVADGTPLPEDFDTYVSVMSIASRFGRRQDLPPLRLNVPVTAAPAITAAEGLKIGLCWRGNPNHARDGERSVPADEIRRQLAAIPGVTFFSLQVEGDELDDMATPLSPHIRDFRDTANLVQQLDLVVTIDTSVAHLCGTLGVRTWLLTLLSPDWRWGTAGEGTPWYPSIRMFRQRSLGDWGAPLADVRAALELEARHAAAAARQLS
jgi:Flp pilus assembly protein TadD